MIHALKEHPEHFNNVISGKKTFEVRKNDRDYKTGDLLALNEYDPEKKIYTGRSCLVYIDYILNDEQYCLPGHIVMSIKPCGVIEYGAPRSMFKEGVDYTDAAPDAQCEYKGCPMCLSVIDGTIEDKPVLRNILNDTSNKSVEFLIKETEGIITLGWRFKYIKDGNYYGDYIEISQYSTGDDIGEAVSLLFGQLHSCLDALNDEGENVISSEKEDSWRSAVMRTFLGGDGK